MSEKKSGIERRRFPRKPLQVEVGVYTETNFYQGFSENISEGGIFVATYDIKPTGEVIELEFKLPGEEEPIRVKGEVRWVREYNPANPDMIPGMGIQFIELSEEAGKKIEKFIREQREPYFYDL